MRPKPLNSVPPRLLARALKGDLAGWADAGALSRAVGRLRGRRETPRHLYMVLDAARLPENARPRLAAALKPFRAAPLLDDPDHPQLAAHGALLVSHPGGDGQALLDAFGQCDSNTVSAWLVSMQSAEPLERHLRRATFAYGPKGERYLMRWYDPLTTPVLFRLASPSWVKSFLEPVASWWYPVDGARKETWSRVRGGGQPESLAYTPVPLIINDELWEALSASPLPYQILEVADKTLPDAFKSGCYGVRVAKIEDMLDEARGRGLKDSRDLTVYVLSLLKQPSLTRDRHWQEAVKMAAAGKMPLLGFCSA